MNRLPGLFFAITAGIAFLLVVCQAGKPNTAAAGVMNDYKQTLETVSTETGRLVQMVEQHASQTSLQQQFRRARAAYKKVEWLAEYYFPYSAKKINGPALAEVEPEEKNIVIQPEGFQVVEEHLFGPHAGSQAGGLLQQTKLLHANIGRLRYLAPLQETTDAHVFDALRLELFRVTTLGITGFDSPLSGNCLQEAAATLQGIQHILSFYKHNAQEQAVEKILDSSVRFVLSAKGVDSFNRMACIKQYLNPLSVSLLALQRELAIPIFTEPRALDAGAATLFQKRIFHPDFYTSGTQAYSNADKVRLGEKLFYDNILSGNGKRSCATCHEPARAFTDGRPASFSVNGKTSIRRNAPTLLNAALQPALFYDMRVNYLEDQAKDVISNADEMHGSLEKTVRHVNSNPAYQVLFKKVWGDQAVSEAEVKNSIAAYIRSLVRIDSRFDRYMNGDQNVMNQLEVDGFNVFAGKARCATCHFIPLFNGSNPPRFDKTDAEVIGVPARADTLHAVLDEDEGKGNLYGIELHRHAFKTPTLRNIALTAPYMHNGVFSTLEEVVEFYNRGGGAGLGLVIKNQTLPAVRLNLSDYEKKSLVAFLKALTDTCKIR